MDCLIQGYEGCFHEMAMHQISTKKSLRPIPCDSFDALAEGLESRDASIAVMAIENSIAGSILQNYRILRQYDLQIIGETYLKIHHQLMALPGQKIDELVEVISHPMALNQCLDFLDQYPGMARKEFSDTALAAKEIAAKQIFGKAAIASALAAEIYGLEILAEDIESNEHNYTRFFILERRNKKERIEENFDKASIYVRLTHKPGSLLSVLTRVQDCGLNLSKLQSFPVLGVPGEYYFFVDLEFEDLDNYKKFMREVISDVVACEELGLYHRAELKTE